MTRNPGLRAGILGAAASVILSLLALIPFFGCLIMPISLFLYLGIGMLAAYLQLRRRPHTSKQRVAQLGFLAGLVTGLADGVVGLATVPLALPLTGGSQAILAQLPPSVLDLVAGLGLAPAQLFSTGGPLLPAAAEAYTYGCTVNLPGRPGAI